MNTKIIKKTKSEDKEPEIIIEVDSRGFEVKNQKNINFQSTIPKKTSLPKIQATSIHSKYKPVEKAIVKEAFINLKKTIYKKTLFHLNLKILIKIFKGLIARQVLENYFKKKSIKKPFFQENQNDYNQLRLNFGTLVVEDKKHVVLDLKKDSAKRQVFIIRKTKWEYIKRDCKKNSGRLPDSLFFIKIYENNSNAWCNILESKNLEEKLSVLEKWVLNYSGNYSAEILGWINGIDIEKLNDSSRIQPQDLTLEKPSFWCYVSDPCFKPIDDFSLSV